MTTSAADLGAFLAAHASLALVEIAGTRGSTPRETGATMLVSASATHGTIGGGQLEYMAIDKARQLLRGSRATLPARGRETRIGEHEVCATLDIPLGPEIGQCCGGRVEIAIRLVDKRLADELIAAAEAEDDKRPRLYIFGGGHVGKALAAAAALLPLQVIVVETRADELDGVTEAVETQLTPMPEEVVRAAPPGSAYVVLTHDHALDFLIVSEALKRRDAAYVGMIGSKTKKATFKNWFLKNAGGSEALFARLITPIGGDAVRDKRPEVIAALAAAEIVTALVLQREPVSSTPA